MEDLKIKNEKSKWKYHNDPDYRKRRNESIMKWRRNNREKYNKYLREYRRNKND